MKRCYYDEKSNTVYIATKYIMPSTKGLSFKEACKLQDEVFKMSYEDRIEKYASDEDKLIIRDMINSHPGCKISEYC